MTLSAPERKIEALQSEILADATSGPVLVELIPGEVSVRVLPARMWRLSGYSAIKDGDFLKWAEKCLASVADYEAFVEADPTFEQINQFFTRFGESTGEGSGEVGNEGNSNSSSNSPTRSRRTRKS